MIFFLIFIIFLSMIGGENNESTDKNIIKHCILKIGTSLLQGALLGSCGFLIIRARKEGLLNQKKLNFLLNVFKQSISDNSSDLLLGVILGINFVMISEIIRMENKKSLMQYKKLLLIYEKKLLSNNNSQFPFDNIIWLLGKNKILISNFFIIFQLKNTESINKKELEKFLDFIKKPDLVLYSSNFDALDET